MTDDQIRAMTIGDLERISDRLKAVQQTLLDARGLFGLLGAPAPQVLQAAPPTQHPSVPDAPAPRPEVTFIGEDPKTARPVIPIAPRPGVSAFAPMPPKLAALTDLPKDLQQEMGRDD